jgi:hypothetical protein
VPALAELSLHNGTIYRWNRPIYDVVDGRPHLRVENRVLPAGPTVVDAVAGGLFTNAPVLAPSVRKARKAARSTAICCASRVLPSRSPIPPIPTARLSCVVWHVLMAKSADRRADATCRSAQGSALRLHMANGSRSP